MDADLDYMNLTTSKLGEVALIDRQIVLPLPDSFTDFVRVHIFLKFRELSAVFRG